MNLCFDLDGPIIDVTDRYYRAYLESLKDTKVKKEQILTKEDVWKFKQNRISDLEIGILSGLSINESEDSAEIRRTLTFKQEYLAQDKIFDDVYKTFDYLKSKNIFFYVVTLRRESQLQEAVKQFKLNKYLSIERLFGIPNDQKFTNDYQEKYVLLVNAINKLKLNPPETWLIGDADTDIYASRLAKYAKIVSISRGIRSKEQLAILKPDFVIGNLIELQSILNDTKILIGSN